MSTTPRHLGKYELQERLGSGGMAEVWKALDTQLRRYVAIKLLHSSLLNDSEFITRFLREAQVIASLHHPNIVQIHDFHISQPPESDSTTAYMVMDYVEGQTLADYIRSTSRAGKFPQPVEIVHLFSAIATAIDYAHQHGMVHRDIKPANILLDKRNTSRNPMGEPILSDFGIARLIGASTKTLSGLWLGTPLYISPEQAQGHPGNERSDIYSVGVVLYELCTGVPPFQGDNPAAIMMQHINVLPTPPSLINPNIPPALSMVILRALAKDPLARFASASTMAAALAEAFNLPVPDELGQPTFPNESMYMPTYLTPRSASMPGQQLSSPSLPTISSSTPGSLSPAQAAFYQNNMPVIPVTPNFAQSSPGLPAISGAGGMVAGANATPVLTPTQLSATPVNPQQPQNMATPPAVAFPAATPFPIASPPKKRTFPTRYLLFAIPLVLVLLVAGLGSWTLLKSGNTPPPASTSIVGHATLFSSGQVNNTSNQGLNDEIQIALQNVPAPRAGKVYYAWLKGDLNQPEQPALLLGNLTVTHGSIQFTYRDSQHTNLLATYSQLLITQEDASTTPEQPTFDQSLWSYYAVVPQTPAKGQKFSMLDHLRHLLSGESLLESNHLQGGLDIWYFRNSEEILEFSASARDEWQTQEYDLMHRQIVRVLDYLDGQPFVHNDVPAGTPFLVQPANYASIPMLELQPKTQSPPGYIYHITLHMAGVLSAPGSTPYQQNLATQISTGLDNVNAWLMQVRKDAQQLVKMNDAQLAQPSTLSILNDMATEANYAYVGRINPLTNQQEIGAVQIYTDIQHLAVFNITVYKQ
ncbi:MAG TPA: protein kinase [Ktedonobacteraceae bacterium]|nr:protein kinase [Ktedonobacteraceae bacterium]